MEFVVLGSLVKFYSLNLPTFCIVLEHPLKRDCFVLHLRLMKNSFYLNFRNIHIYKQELNTKNCSQPTNKLGGESLQEIRRESKV